MIEHIDISAATWCITYTRNITQSPPKSLSCLYFISLKKEMLIFHSGGNIN